MWFIYCFKILEKLGFWRFLTFFWIKIGTTRPLSEAETEAARMVFSEGQLHFDKIRIHQNSPLCRLSGGRPLASFHIIHYPNSAQSMAVLIHELAHVAQFEAIGARYAPEALLAQFHLGHAAYDFEKKGQLIEQAARGHRFADLNREAQAQLVEAYFIELTERKNEARLAEFAPFLAEMRAGCASCCRWASRA